MVMEKFANRGAHKRRKAIAGRQRGLDTAWLSLLAECRDKQ